MDCGTPTDNASRRQRFGTAPPETVTEDGADDAEPDGAERWAFRRFDAPAQAQTAADTWEELHRRGLPIMTELQQHDGSLYETSRETEETMRALGIPRTTECSAAARQSAASARILLKTLQQIAPPPPPTTPETPETLAKGEDAYTVTLSRRQIADLVRHLEAWLVDSGKLAARTNATIETAQATRKRLGEFNTRIRDFILTIWSINAEKAKAYPPFWSDIGPIEATLHGIGRTTTSKTSTHTAAATTAPTPTGTATP